MKVIKLIAVALLFSLVACATESTISSDAVEKTASPAVEKVITTRTEKEMARDQYRNPVETLQFFQVEPGMSVAEALPGGGWYSKILANHLGSEGALYGLNYVDDMWARFGFFSPERIAERIASTAQFPEKVAEFTANGIASKGFTFNTVPDELKGTVDRVLFIRALHNLNRFEQEAGTMSAALAATSDLLKANGLVGVVQHRLPESHTEKTDGSRGYLKYSDLIAAFAKAGFELAAESEINANSNDQPSESDIVWRLPPSFNGSRDNEELKQKMMEIGESDRMTLLFKKK